MSRFSLVARWRWYLAALGVVALVLYPASVDPFYVTLADLICIAALGALALNFLIGIAGQVSIGSAAFMAIGAYTAATIAIRLTAVPFPLVLLASALVAAAVGVVVAIPAFRVRGLYLMIATLALHYIVVYGAKVYQVRSVGSGGFLLPAASIGGWRLGDSVAWYAFLVPLTALTATAFANLIRSRFGRAWRMVRDRDVAADVIGIDVRLYKVMAFAISSFVIGLQGAVYGYLIGNVNAETFNLDLAIQFVAMIIVGGLGSIAGSIVGAAFVTALPILIQNLVLAAFPDGPPASVTGNVHNVEALVYGALIVLFLLFEPRGLVRLGSNTVARVARRGG